MTSRPTYETSAHLDAEADVAMQLQAAWGGVSLMKLPRRYVLDYGIYRERRLTGFCEIKCRTHLPTTYPTLLVSAAKWREAKLWRLTAQLRTVLVVRYADGTIWRCRLDEMPEVLVSGGRADRADPQDHEPMLQIPVAVLVKL